MRNIYEEVRSEVDTEFEIKELEKKKLKLARDQRFKELILVLDQAGAVYKKRNDQCVDVETPETVVEKNTMDEIGRKRYDVCIEITDNEKPFQYAFHITTTFSFSTVDEVLVRLKSDLITEYRQMFNDGARVESRKKEYEERTKAESPN